MFNESSAKKSPKIGDKEKQGGRWYHFTPNGWAEMPTVKEVEIRVTNGDQSPVFYEDSHIKLKYDYAKRKVVALTKGAKLWSWKHGGTFIRKYGRGNVKQSRGWITPNNDEWFNLEMINRDEPNYKIDWASEVAYDLGAWWNQENFPFYQIRVNCSEYWRLNVTIHIDNQHLL